MARYLSFIDQVKIYVKAGDGGKGCVSFRREKYVAYGGPNGGNGGDGGSVILEGDSGLLTLLDFKYHPHLKAKKGQHGQGKDCDGRTGMSFTARVPLGTIVTDIETGSQLGEIISAGQKLVIARGGKGGRGNKQFATSTNRAPRRAEPGQPGEEKRLQLELKLIADIALVGTPNAGKSTLINAISRARSKIGSYPFTTLNPVLGVVDPGGGKRMVIADMPGLIKGASKGRGLGDRFLRHIERTRAVVFILDMTGSPETDLRMLQDELRLFKPKEAKKKYIIAANKMDLEAARENLPQLRKKIKRVKIFPISALTGEGINGLLKGLDGISKSALPVE